MSIDYKIYKFAEFELDEEEEKLFNGGEDLLLTSTEYNILLELLQKRGKTVSTADLFEELWGLESEAQENNVPTHIKNIRHKFGDAKRERFIKTDRIKKGYKFIFEPVFEEIKREGTSVNESFGEVFRRDSIFESDAEIVSPDGTATAEDRPKRQALTKTQIAFAIFGMIAGYIFIRFGRTIGLCAADECFEQTIFIWLAAIFYAVLTGIGVLLECAYDFDRYGWNAAKMIPSIMLVNGGSLFAALSVAGNLLEAESDLAFWTGLLFLVIGAIISCVLAAFVLPNKPVTAAKFQTQSAIGAFCKNVVIYFLPLYTFFGLLTFCFVFGSTELVKNIAFPIAFAVVWMIFFVFSYLSTNYLSDNLLTEKDGERYKYHGLFSLLLQLRMIFCFITALGSVVYYFIHTLTHFPLGG